MDRLKQIEQFRKEGLTFREIGLKLGISRARAEQLLNPERQKAYYNSPKYRNWFRAWDKHRYHLEVNRKFNNCERCNPSPQG